MANFYPRPPRGGRPVHRFADEHTDHISIHVPREGDDAGKAISCNQALNFYPRPPRGGRLFIASPQFRTMQISIHVPREGDDALLQLLNAGLLIISIHVPREGDD